MLQKTREREEGKAKGTRLLKGVCMKRDEALEFVSFLRGLGLRFEVVGGLYKGKPNVHDIDLVVRLSDWENSIFFSTLRSLNGKPPAVVEFYIADDVNYEPLCTALRATTHEAIKGRLMKGLRYRKRRWE
jgi:hypothetical protein